MTAQNLATQQDNRAVGLAPTTFRELVDWATRVAKTSMVPKAYKDKPDEIIVAVQMGHAVGLPPMQSLQSIAVINGMPSLWGDGALAVVKARPDCEDVEETPPVMSDANPTAICTIRRTGQKPVTRTFSKEDAIRADLWETEARVKRKGQGGGTYEADNDSPWYRYPQRMLQMRARSWAMRDSFPDALRGLGIAEELQDLLRQREKYMGEIEQVERENTATSAADIKARLAAKNAASATAGAAPSNDGEKTDTGAAGPDTSDSAALLADFQQMIADAQNVTDLEGVGKMLTDEIEVKMTVPDYKALRKAYAARKAQMEKVAS